MPRPVRCSGQVLRGGGNRPLALVITSCAFFVCSRRYTSHVPPRLHPPLGGWPFPRIAATLDEALPRAAAEHLSIWLDRLVEWNARVDLTAARNSDELIDLMMADALRLSLHLPRGARVIDVGTGAGAPGLALAILRPDLDVTLVEPLGKRGAFLRGVIGALNRLDVTLEGETGEALALAREGEWDVALSRATLPPAAWLRLAARLVRRGGSAWVFLARESAPIFAGMMEVDAISYVWPLTGAKRRLVRYEREAARAPEGGLSP
jgi:16S rRNA (guanine527-N7)-methyltransferase